MNSCQGLHSLIECGTASYKITGNTGEKTPVLLFNPLTHENFKI